MRTRQPRGSVSFEDTNIAAFSSMSEWRNEVRKTLEEFYELICLSKYDTRTLNIGWWRDWNALERRPSWYCGGYSWICCAGIWRPASHFALSRIRWQNLAMMALLCGQSGSCSVVFVHLIVILDLLVYYRHQFHPLVPFALSREWTCVWVRPTNKCWELWWCYNGLLSGHWWRVAQRASHQQKQQQVLFSAGVRATASDQIGKVKLICIET